MYVHIGVWGESGTKWEIVEHLDLWKLECWKLKSKMKCWKFGVTSSDFGKIGFCYFYV